MLVEPSLVPQQKCRKDKNRQQLSAQHRSLGRPQPRCERSLSWWLESVEVAHWHNKNQLKANYFVNDLADAILLVQLDAIALLIWPARVKITWVRPNNRALKTGCKPAAGWSVAGRTRAARGACRAWGQHWIGICPVCPETCGRWWQAWGSLPLDRFRQIWQKFDAWQCTRAPVFWEEERAWQQAC